MKPEPDMTLFPSPFIMSTTKEEEPSEFKSWLEKEEEMEETVLPISPFELFQRKKEEVPDGLCSSPAPFSVQNNLSVALQTVSPPLEVVALFEMMVSEIHHMKDTGLTETTIRLSMQEFAASPFFGTEIVIQEYSTAPKTFNIRLVAPPQAIELMHPHMHAFLAALNAHTQFQVHRLETEHSLLKRKEKVSDDRKRREQKK